MVRIYIYIYCTLSNPRIGGLVSCPNEVYQCRSLSLSVAKKIVHVCIFSQEPQARGQLPFIGDCYCPTRRVVRALDKFIYMYAFIQYIA